MGLLCALGACVVAAAAVRVWAAQDELWLDEIWTLLSLGRNNNSLLDILTAHHDNNHYLITFWMYFTSPQQNWFVYRIPSVLAGIGTVILAARVAARWGNRAALAAAILTGASFMMVFYASEARGYALAGFFSLVAFLALDRYLDRRELGMAAVFGLATILGTLSHLTFVQFYAGALAWSVFALTKRKGSSQTEFAPLIALHIVPASFLMMLYAFDVREMKFGGGDPYVMHDMVLNACALAVGTFGAAQPIVWGSVGLGIIAAVAALLLLWREKADVWIFFLVAFVITPTLLLSVKPPPVLHERYFYLNILFFLILLSYLFDRVAARGRASMYGAIAILGLFVLPNANLTYHFLRVGRGHFFDALAYMAEHSRGADVLMSGDAEFTYRLYTEFYGPYVPGDHDFHIITIVPEMPVEPEWVILNNQDQPYAPKPAILDSKGNEAFTLERVFPYAGLSGAHFAIYHRTTMRNAPSQAEE
ncbi:MAG TPA: glycosyltransferase family 39 protein [Pirellulales bacterium]